jgi:hypothetical protein
LQADPPLIELRQIRPAAFFLHLWQQHGRWLERRRLIERPTLVPCDAVEAGVGVQLIE